ncbi:DUF6224 family protein [Streptomyces nigrescens]
MPGGPPAVCAARAGPALRLVHAPLVLSISAGDVPGMILQLTGTGLKDVPEFLDGIRSPTWSTEHGCVRASGYGIGVVAPSFVS